MSQLIIGPHVSIAKGYYKAAQEALDMGANTFQFFTRNPRGGAVRKIDHKDIEKWREFMEEHKFGPVLAHAPYTLNMASGKEDVRDFAFRAFKEDLERLEEIPCDLYNFHPGSHTKDGDEIGITRIVDILNRVLWPEMKTTVLLELMAGKGTEIGHRFEQAAEIIERTELKGKLGVCLDTCHVYSAGYDIRENLEGVIDELDSVIGLDRLKAIHLNDSMTPFASKKDRHEKLGQGTLGEQTFVNILNEERLRSIPIYLETPNENEGYAREIAFLRGVAAGLAVRGNE